MATFTVKIKPFDVPTVVWFEGTPRRRQDGFTPLEGTPIHELEDDTIKELIADFATSLMEQVRRARMPKMDPAALHRQLSGIARAGL